jgi:hypothetical protein
MKELKLILLIITSASCLAIAQEPVKEKQSSNNKPKKSSVAPEPQLMRMEKITIQSAEDTNDTANKSPQLQRMDAINKQPE